MSFSINKPLNQNLNSYYFQAEKKPASLADQAKDKSDENKKLDEVSQNVETAKQVTPKNAVNNVSEFYNLFIISIANDMIRNKELYFPELDES